MATLLKYALVLTPKLAALFHRWFKNTDLLHHCQRNLGPNENIFQQLFYTMRSLFAESTSCPPQSYFSVLFGWYEPSHKSGKKWWNPLNAFKAGSSVKSEDSWWNLGAAFTEGSSVKSEDNWWNLTAAFTEAAEVFLQNPFLPVLLSASSMVMLIKLWQRWKTKKSKWSKYEHEPIQGDESDVGKDSFIASEESISGAFQTSSIRLLTTTSLASPDVSSSYSLSPVPGSGSATIALRDRWLPTPITISQSPLAPTNKIVTLSYSQSHNSISGLLISRQIALNITGKAESMPTVSLTTSSTLILRSSHTGLSQLSIDFSKSLSSGSDSSSIKVAIFDNDPGTAFEAPLGIANPACSLLDADAVSSSGSCASSLHSSFVVRKISDTDSPTASESPVGIANAGSSSSGDWTSSSDSGSETSVDSSTSSSGLGASYNVGQFITSHILNLQVIDILGRGNQATSYKVHDGTSILAAKISHSDCLSPNLLSEFNILSSLNHPNVISVHGKIPRGFLMECLSLDLQAFIKISGHIAPNVRNRLSLDILKAVVYIHENGVAHLDIKPENILLTVCGIPKLCDFGLAVKYRNDDGTLFNLEGYHGTAHYCSPEMFVKSFLDNDDIIDLPKSDCWSVGVTLYQIMSGQLLFEGTTVGELFRNQKMNNYNYPSFLSNLSPVNSKYYSFMEMIKCLCRRNPVTRFSAQQALCHECFKEPEEIPV